LLSHAMCGHDWQVIFAGAGAEVWQGGVYARLFAGKFNRVRSTPSVVIKQSRPVDVLRV